VATLLRAVDSLEARLGPLCVSSLYRTAPISRISQPDYINLAVLALTDSSPAQLLDLAHEIEEQEGRQRSAKPTPGCAEPRTLDIDLLVVGELTASTSELTLPHPRLHQRRFVLAPLAQIAPDLPIPPEGTTVRQHLEALDLREDRGGVVERLPPQEPI